MSLIREIKPAVFTTITFTPSVQISKQLFHVSPFLKNVNTLHISLPVALVGKG